MQDKNKLSVGKSKNRNGSKNNNDVSPRSRSRARVDKKKSGQIKFDSQGKEVSDKKMKNKHSKNSSDPSKGTDNRRSLK